MLQKYRTLAQFYENCNIVQRFFDFFRDVRSGMATYKAKPDPSNKRARIGRPRNGRRVTTKICKIEQTAAE